MPIQEHNIDDNEKSEAPKPYSKYRPKNDGEFKINFKIDPKKYYPHLLVVFIFFMSLYLVFLFVDGVIMPSIVHSHTLVKIPDLTGKNLDEGIISLRQKNLRFKVAQEIYSEEYPSHSIVKQVPYVGSEVKEGRTVYLTVSKGKETVGVPYLVGLTLSQARIELMKRGLEVGEIEYDFSDHIGKDSIMLQSSGNGTFLPYGSAVNLTVSQGSNAQMPVPTLVGLRFDEIEILLTENGFVLGNITYQTNETFTPNTVISQNPAQGEMLLNGSKIDVVISK